MKITAWKNALTAGALDAQLTTLYGVEALVAQRERWLSALDKFALLYGDERQVSLFSVPGRSEVSGNHTDHNHGRVLCASVDLDCIAVAARREDGVISIHSEGFSTDTVLLDQIAVSEDRFYTSHAIIEGVVDGFRRRGFGVGGYDAYTTSNVFKGSGLSSSAAYEVLVGKMLSYFWCEDAVNAPTLAKVGQYAENVFFGKPCGLMDQMACAVGGLVTIDFADPTEPVVEKMAFDLAEAGYRLCIVNTGGNHADLNEDYASVPAEMKAVAQCLGGKVLRDVPYEAFLAEIPKLRERVGDRAVLRALHFFGENERVAKQVAALRTADLDTFLSLVIESGRSSYMRLQNVYTVKNVAEQGLSLALCMAEEVLSALPAAWRVHGGGFAGTIQAFVPQSATGEFAKKMDAIFGAGATKELRVRPIGATHLAEIG